MREVLDSGRYILGPEVEAWESEFGAYVGTEHCIGVANGTDGLTIALRALGVAPGDEVVVPAVTFYATAEAVVNTGACPIFADVDPDTWCMTASTVEPVLSDRTAAVVPVHLFGNPASIIELTELARAQPGRPVRVLEDAAQAAGARIDGRMAGALGDAGVFSFYPSKNLAAFGDAGAIVTDAPDVADACRLLRAHGSVDKEVHSTLGYNSRLDELQAAALRIMLPELESWTRARREVATSYRELGLGELVSLPVERPRAKACYHLYVVSTPKRDALAEGLSQRGIGNRVYYAPPLHRQPGLAAYAPDHPLPGSERYAAECLALPMGPALQRDQIEHVVAMVGETLR